MIASDVIRAGLLGSIPAAALMGVLGLEHLYVIALPAGTSSTVSLDGRRRTRVRRSGPPMRVVSPPSDARTGSGQPVGLGNLCGFDRKTRCDLSNRTVGADLA